MAYLSKSVPPPYDDGTVRRVCPVCGSRAYSRGGIHPQCAQQRADAARMVEVKKARRPKAQPAHSLWRKQCPRCKAVLHVRKRACSCGYSFPTSKPR